MLCRGIPVNQLEPVLPPGSSIESIAESGTAAVPNSEPVELPTNEGEEGDSLPDLGAVKVRDVRLMYTDAQMAVRAAVEKLVRKD